MDYFLSYRAHTHARRDARTHACTHTHTHTETLMGIIIVAKRNYENLLWCNTDSLLYKYGLFSQDTVE